jgi:hypothetical protein
MVLTSQTNSSPMFKKCVSMLLGASSFVAVTYVPQAQAANFEPAFSFVQYPVKTLDPGPTIDVLGYHFETEFSRPVKSIGIFRNPNPPSNKNHSIGIWDFSVNPKQLIFQQQITENTQCTVLQSYCWFNISDLSLKANIDYVIASTWGENDPLPFEIPSTDLSLASNFMLGTTAELPSGATAPQSFLVDLNGYVPTQISSGSENGFYSVNLSFESFPSNPSKVPAPLPLLGVAAAFGMSRKIRRRISSSI